ncbi:Protein-lysine N-methyltransferase efm5 [Coemansia sp. RSA 2337]|nr:Protein-lysine N-methyltransferase efm5 [Coemansia sp. S680]KAJ2048352.1 Protein-lysine N-methyltransferase efm5 [Coemansia sp. S2]KAJ2062593.1 Protein-lysine N-methyltransferase efm5 [Coemansia sp. S155-1]KAJ2075940.1 Protein-lysine N-methyltransferase efm5 [Coemansia sp. S100]KAJ2095272.1 Protein-lysine N-methyltransferase efm5 [Coemansia sp. S142-1]KAJ2458785.1 Protein-lysine N-methyltransferase efm5 [Coemansia sp. RSA 2337]
MFANPLNRGIKGLSAPVTLARRGKADVVIRKTTGQVLVGRGTYGRQSWNGQTATVFGCTGFLGRYIVARLAREGTKVIVPYRGLEEYARHLRPTGDLGMVIPMEFDLRNSKQIEECVRYSDVVINLIGRNYETKNFSFDQVHIEGAQRIADVSREAGVSRLIHMSSINAKSNAHSQALVSKAFGEQRVREHFPGANIVRSATMYGYEDELLNNIGKFKHFYMTVNHAQQKLRPVCVSDVAHAIGIIRDNEDTVGQTFELYNPKEYSRKDVVELVQFLLHEKIWQVNVPPKLLRLAAQVANALPFHYTSHHEVDLMSIDDVPSKDPSIQTFADLGIQPHTLELAALQYIRHYRPPQHEEDPMEPKGYKAFRKPPVPVSNRDIVV